MSPSALSVFHARRLLSAVPFIFFFDWHHSDELAGVFLSDFGMQVEATWC